jgi:hypothetical protein
LCRAWSGNVNEGFNAATTQHDINKPADSFPDHRVKTIRIVSIIESFSLRSSAIQNIALITSLLGDQYPRVFNSISP